MAARATISLTSAPVRLGASTYNFNGLGGNDTFTVTGALAGGAALNIDGGSPTLPSSPGDTFNVPAGSTVTPTGPGTAR